MILNIIELLQYANGETENTANTEVALDAGTQYGFILWGGGAAGGASQGGGGCGGYTKVKITMP